MSTYSTQFFSGLVTATNLNLFVPPPGVIVIRDITGGDRSGASSTDDVTFFLCASGSIEAVIENFQNIGPYGSYHWQGRIVLGPGQTVGIGAGAWPQGIVISGYTLSAT